MSRKTLKVLNIAIVIFIFICLFSITCLHFTQKKIIQGVTVRGIDLSGLDTSEGIERLQELENTLRQLTIKLKYKNETYQLPVSETGVKLNKQAMVQHALSTGRQGILWGRWYTLKRIKKEGFEIPVKVYINKKTLNQLVNDITSDLMVKPKNAAIKISNNKVKIIPSHEGRKVDLTHVYSSLTNILEKDGPAQIDLRIVEISPAQTTEDIKKMGINELLGTYRTTFNSSNLARSYNIEVAAAALDGLMVPPNKIVSFNEIVGPRSTEAGYKDAGVIVNNELIQGPGGGVCQVSTTLYNSVLLSGLEVIQRSNHSLPVSYVPIGRDATVAYNSIDFKFRNNTEKYIYIKTIVGEGSLTIKIFGNRDYKQNISVQTWVTETLEPDVIYEESPNLYKGQEIVKQEGAKGYIAKGIRIFYNNGVVVKEEPLPNSKYNSLDKIINISED